MNPVLSAKVPSPDQDSVKEVSLSTFMADVIEASRHHLIVVDFWATWCGPCKQLTPILEKVVRATKGAAKLAKIDIDRNPEIAQQMGIQSVPAVFAFFQGRPVDGFMGALPESQVTSWLDRLLKALGATKGENEERPELDFALEQATEALAAHDIETAQSIYASVLEAQPHHIEAYVGMIRCLLASGKTDEATHMFKNVPAEIAKDKALDAVRAALELATQAKSGGEISEIEARVAANPKDCQALFDLAMAHYAAGHREKAVENLLTIVQRDRKWNEEAARKQLVKFFEAFGPMDPLTVATRRRLSSILFS